MRTRGSTGGPNLPQRVERSSAPVRPGVVRARWRTHQAAGRARATPPQESAAPRVDPRPSRSPAAARRRAGRPTRRSQTRGATCGKSTLEHSGKGYGPWPTPSSEPPPTRSSLPRDEDSRPGRRRGRRANQSVDTRGPHPADLAPLRRARDRHGAMTPSGRVPYAGPARGGHPAGGLGEEHSSGEKAGSTSEPCGRVSLPLAAEGC